MLSGCKAKGPHPKVRAHPEKPCPARPCRALPSRALPSPAPAVASSLSGYRQHASVTVVVICLVAFESGEAFLHLGSLLRSTRDGALDLLNGSLCLALAAVHRADEVDGAREAA